MAKGSFFNKVKDLARSAVKTHGEREYDDDDFEEFDDGDEGFNDDYLDEIEAQYSSRTQSTRAQQHAVYAQQAQQAQQAQSQPAIDRQPSVNRQPQYSFGEHKVASDNVFQLSQAKKKASAKFKFALVKIEKLEDAVAAADHMLSGNTVALLDLHGVPQNVARRIIDFLDGVRYTCGARIELIADFTYVIVPESVELSGDFLSQVDTSDFAV